MDNSIWRFGVVANIAQYHIGDDGNEYYGTKAFTPATKVYLYGKFWDASDDYISVIGRNRFGRLVFEGVPVNCLVDVRAQRIFKPTVLEKIDYLEKFEGIVWWGRTADDRRETKKFVADWK